MKRLKFLLALLAVAGVASCEETIVSSITLRSAKTLVAEAAGNVYSVEFETAENWTATPSASWIVPSLRYGDGGNATLSLTVAENKDYDSREGYLALASGTAKDTVFVKQGEVKALIVGNNRFEVPAAGGNVGIEVSANVRYNAAVEKEAAGWISVEQAVTKALEKTTVTAKVAPNEGFESREGKIEISADGFSETVVISQEGRDPVFEITGTDQRVPAEGGSFTVRVNADIAVTVDAPSWLSYVTDAEGNYVFTATANNTDGVREGQLRLYNQDFAKSQSFLVSQKSTKSIYILAIGNSFSSDAMEYLQPILYELGYRDIFLGNLYIGGCSLQTHAAHMAAGETDTAYDYRVCTTGSWSSSKGSSLTALKSRDWDFVSVQQVSGLSGVPDSYEPYLTNIMNKVKELSPDSRKMWHMTWAYQANSTHADFPRYGSDQMTMYQSILSTVQSKVLSRDDFDFIIPSGTAVQNLRTSFIGDVITRDGYHMSYDNGRLLTALMWARQITGKSIADVAYTPAAYTYTDRQIAAIKESVENAFKEPFQVTQSQYKGEDKATVLPTEELKAIFTGAGYKLDDYTPIPLLVTHNAYYNSSNSSVLQTQANNTAANLTRYAATQIFAKSQLPNGTVLVLKDGYQYRPEGWVTLTTKNSTRPANVTQQIVVLNDAWWGTFEYRAFNLALAGAPAISEEQQKSLEECFAIFVPGSQAEEVASTDKILLEESYDPAQYTKLAFTYTKGAYYYSTNASYLSNLVTTASNSGSFVATNIVEKSAIPEGSLIVITTGFQYRPEGWQTLGVLNSNTRPGAVTTKLVTVTSSWWGNYNYRAFNLSKTGNPKLTTAEMDEAIASFAVYVPK